MSRLLTDRTVDWRNPEYDIILQIGSGSHSDFKFAIKSMIGMAILWRATDPILF
jgi:hypothetical protein